MQFCDSTCQQCSRAYFRWLKNRMAQMSMTHDDGVPSFASCAATSVRPVRPAIGSQVRVTTLGYEHTATVVHNAGTMGADGRYWVQVSVSYREGVPPWEAHFERQHLMEVV